MHVAQGRTVDTAHLVVDDAAGRESLYVGMTRGRERNTAYVVTERARAADLSPELRPAPDIQEPSMSEDRPRSRHRLGVLASVLEREQAEQTATDTMRQELERAASLATLAPMWAEVTRAHATRRYEGTLRSLLAAGDWRRYEQDPERGTLARLLHAADLAGHDVGGLLRHATAEGDFGGARSVAAVLHGRVQRIVGTPEPRADTGYADRTPVIEDPVAGRFARDLAAAMDERVSLLGNRVAADRPVWAVRYLGELPADPVERADWIRRAGAAAAYREERGYFDEAEAIGPAPERGSPEQRASWHAAYTALRMPEEGREVAATSDGELWARRAAYARDTAWAPPYVAGELREAHIAEGTYRSDAVRAWHRAGAALDEAQRSAAQREAGEYGALAQEIGAYREALTEITDARRRWHATTEPDRPRALVADAELRRRHPDAELPPLHPGEEPSSLEPDPGPVRSGPNASPSEADPGSVPDRRGAVLDIEAALAAARKAEKILAEREHRAGLDDDVMRRREADALREASARRSAVRQDPAPSRRPMSLELDELELEAGQ